MGHLIDEYYKVTFKWHEKYKTEKFCKSVYVQADTFDEAFSRAVMQFCSAISMATIDQITMKRIEGEF